MTLAATPPPAPAPTNPEPGAALRRLPMAVLLAVVTTFYIESGHIAFQWQSPSSVGVAVLGMLVAQFLAAWLMLSIVGVGYRFVQASGAGAATHRRLALLVAGCTLAGLAVHGGVHAMREPGLVLVSDLSKLLAWNLSFAALLVLAHHFAERSRDAAIALGDAELRRVGLERELDSARLQLLQAQSEPHFLFNALANVRRLMRTDAPAARTLLTDLLRYLEEALPQLRDEHSTLGREAGLVRAYLAVHQVRMGARLASRIDIPDALADRSVPPMVLLTLVENALKHGLQPRVEGGTVQVSARLEPGRLVLTVADDGQGMGSGSGHGTGLANLRARLRQTYGSAASLALAVNEPRGVVATVTLPEPAP
jgi:LytS/YehU family sensor histidine kinase